MSFVLDASLTLAWCFEDEHTRFTTAALEALLNHGAIVPTIWIHEVTNGLRTVQKSSRIDEQAVRTFTSMLEQLPIETVSLDAGTMFGEVRRIALQHNISAYDAAYLVLARLLQMPLATLDGTGRRAGLKQAALALSVTVLSEKHLGSRGREPEAS